MTQNDKNITNFPNHDKKNTFFLSALNYFVSYRVFLCKSTAPTVLQIRAGQWLIATNLWPLTTHPYYVMIIVNSGFSKKFFFIIFKTAICKCFSKQVLWEILQYSQENICVNKLYFNLAPKETSTQLIPVEIAKVLRTTFLWNTSSGCFCQFDKVPVQWWACANFLSLSKTKYMGWFLLRRFADLVRVIYTLLVETIPTSFYWLTCRKQKLTQVFVHYLMTNLMINK